MTYSLHPGAVQTDLARNMIGPEKWDRVRKEGSRGWEAILLNVVAKFIEDRRGRSVHSNISRSH
jgi:hypothetical protein